MMLVEILLIVTSPPCPQCQRARQALKQVCERVGSEARVVEIDLLDPAAEPYGVVLAPAVVIDGVIVCMGRAPAVDRLVAYIRHRQKLAHGE